jgi:spore germination protein KC
MSRRRLIYLLIFTILAAPFGPAGCWNRREPERLATVLAIGLDYDQQREEFVVLVEVANLAVLAGGQGGGDGGGGGGGLKPSQVLSARGRTVFEALRRVGAISPRELFWSHAEVLVISEDLARHGLQPVLDFFVRERQSRLIVIPLVTDSGVRELFEAEVYPGKVTGDSLLLQYEAVTGTDAVAPVTDMRTVLMQLSQPGIDIFIPRAALVRLQDQAWEQLEEGEGAGAGGGQGQAQGNQPQGGGGQKQIEISGGAAFRGDRMAGWLNNQATRGWFWIVGKAARGSVVFPCPGAGEKHYISVEVFQSVSEIKVSVEQGKPEVKVKITVEGRIQDVACYDHFLAGENPAPVLNRLLAGAVRSDAYAALGAARELGSDIFGFGRAVCRAYPRQWAELEQNWEEHFRNLKVEISVSAKIRRAGLVAEPSQQR